MTPYDNYKLSSPDESAPTSYKCADCGTEICEDDLRGLNPACEYCGGDLVEVEFDGDEREVNYNNPEEFE